MSAPAAGQSARLQTSTSLADLTIEELSRIPITSVSRRPEPLATAPSAIQVITGEEIRRSGASVLPEALLLAPNLQVSQITSNDWSITARGFSGAQTSAGSLSNKLLVMIDGRSIYTPVFGGVFWDANNVLLDDIERIEVVSGPGATQWGVNAVNGVIHVIRKDAADTQGWYGNVTAGALVEDYSLRYGGRMGDNGHYRVYGQRLERDALFADGMDEWAFNQGGFRVDLDASGRDRLTLQGDFYRAREGLEDRRGTNGQNVLGVWQRSYGEGSDLRLAAYFDRRSRDIGAVAFETRTWDVDLQHGFPLGEYLAMVWGLSYRQARDEATDPVTLDFEPSSRTMDNYNGFLQAGLTLVPDRLALTLGTKVTEHEFSGFEVQPSARLAWTPRQDHTIWAAISRAIRAPSRIDVDLRSPGIAGDPAFDSEKLVAWEIGYRVQPTRASTLSIAVFFHDYHDVRSISANPAPPPPLRFANGFETRTSGLEIFGMVAPAEWWRLRGFYTYVDSRFTARDPLMAPGAEHFEALDPSHHATLHSMMDLMANLQLDLVVRHVSSRPQGSLPPTAGVPSYTVFDARLAWQQENWEVALIGQSLNGGHLEYGSQEIPRSIFLRTRLRY